MLILLLENEHLKLEPFWTKCQLVTSVHTDVFECEATAAPVFLFWGRFFIFSKTLIYDLISHQKKSAFMFWNTVTSNINIVKKGWREFCISVNSLRNTCLPSAANGSFIHLLVLLCSLFPSAKYCSTRHNNREETVWHLRSGWEESFCYCLVLKLWNFAALILSWICF